MKFVQATDVGAGALLSILKLLFTTVDRFHAPSYDLHSTVQLFVPSLGQYEPIFIVVATPHVLPVHHNVWLAPLNILYSQVVNDDHHASLSVKVTLKFALYQLHAAGAVILVTGSVLSNLYIPLHVLVFHAKSTEHK